MGFDQRSALAMGNAFDPYRSGTGQPLNPGASLDLAQIVAELRSARANWRDSQQRPREVGGVFEQRRTERGKACRGKLPAEAQAAHFGADAAADANDRKVCLRGSGGGVQNGAHDSLLRYG